MKTITALTLAMTATVITFAFETASAQQRLDQRRWASPEGTVEINNLSGSVRVTGWDKNEVAVTGTLGEGVERMDFSGDSSRTEIRVIIPKNGRNVGDSDLEVRVPEGSRVRVKTMSADIEASKVVGTLDLKTMSGDIRVSDRPREVEVNSMSGDVDISASESRVRAKSVSGPITIYKTVGEVRAENMSGEIIVKESRLERGRFSTMNGEIQFDGDLSPKGVFHFGTMNGFIELRLPANVKADFNVTTGPHYDGNIENEFGPQAISTGGGYGPPGKKLNFSTGSGGAYVTINTMNGTVRLRKK